jgi:hypothetical protein
MFAVLLAACGRAGADKAERAATADAEMAPPSIMALIVAEAIDSATATVPPEKRELPPTTPGGEARQLVLWRLDGAPAKLMVSEPTDAGTMTGSSVWYFKDGRIVFVSGPFARYAFVGGRLVEWTDQHGVVAESDAATLRTREKDLTDAANNWLKEFES